MPPLLPRVPRRVSPPGPLLSPPRFVGGPLCIAVYTSFCRLSSSLHRSICLPLSSPPPRAFVPPAVLLQPTPTFPLRHRRSLFFLFPLSFCRARASHLTPHLALASLHSFSCARLGRTLAVSGSHTLAQRSTIRGITPARVRCAARPRAHDWYRASICKKKIGKRFFGTLVWMLCNSVGRRIASCSASCVASWKGCGGPLSLSSRLHSWGTTVYTWPR